MHRVLIMLASVVLFLWLGQSGTEAAISPVRMAQPEGFLTQVLSRLAVARSSPWLALAVCSPGVAIAPLSRMALASSWMALGVLTQGHSRNSSAVLRPNRFVRLRFVSHRWGDCHVEGAG
jgi:hypothetical protein